MTIVKIQVAEEFCFWSISEFSPPKLCFHMSKQVRESVPYFLIFLSLCGLSERIAAGATYITWNQPGSYPVILGIPENR